MEAIRHFRPRLLALETGASAYEITFVPGLLQTADYAWALHKSNRRGRPREWVDKWVAARLTRQERLTDDEEPLRFDAVVHEFALRLPIGGSEVMRAQLRHLALVTELPTVTLRVLPAAKTCREAMLGGFSVLDFASAGQPSIAQVWHALGHERRDRPDQVHEGKLLVDHLRSLALDPEESAEFIEWAAGLWIS